MKSKIINETDNKLLNRKEINIEFSFDKETPKREVLQAEAIALLKTKPELVVVDKVTQGYGGRVVNVLVYVYNSESEVVNLVPRKKKKELKKKWIEDKKSAKANTEKPKEEAKVEESKSEDKKESKVEEKPKENGKEKGSKGKETSKEQKTE